MTSVQSGYKSEHPCADVSQPWGEGGLAAANLRKESQQTGCLMLIYVCYHDVVHPEIGAFGRLLLMTDTLSNPTRTIEDQNDMNI
jgi:hypothetical protein